MSELLKIEREILEEAAGIREPRAWGAVVGAALEALRGGGYINNVGGVTEKGWHYLGVESPPDRSPQDAHPGQAEPSA